MFPSSRARAWLGAGLLALFALARFLPALLAGGGNCDFFFFLVQAREDLMRPEGEPPLGSFYNYCPLLYRYLQAWMLVGVGSVEGLSIAVNAIHLANAVLLALVLVRLGASGPVAVWAGAWSLFIVELYEGYAGLIEPLVVFAALVGLLAAVRPHRPWWAGGGLVAVAAGLGVAGVAKQQAALYAIGACAAAALSTGGIEARIGRTLTIPLVAAAVFLVLLAPEPLPLAEVVGRLVGHALGYEARHGSFWKNVGGAWAPDPKLAFFLIGLGGVLGIGGLTAAGRRLWSGPRGAVCVLGALWAAAASVQVASRPYPHYLLLAWPPLILAWALLFDFAIRTRWAAEHRFSALAIGTLAAIFPFIRVGGSPGPWLFPPGAAMRAPSVFTAHRAWFPAFDVMRERLPPRACVAVAPPMQWAPHAYLGFRPAAPENPFENPDEFFESSIRSPATEAILCFPEMREFDPSWPDRARAAGFRRRFWFGKIYWLTRGP